MKPEFSEISRQLETWYSRDGGEYLFTALRRHLRPLVDVAFGYHTLQLGPLAERSLLTDSPINHRIHAGQEWSGRVNLVCRCDELPLESDSIDMVVALHTLEFCQNPHHCLREMERVLMPHGHLLVIGFNPRSLMGMSHRVKALARRSPWTAQRAVTQGTLTDWLHLVGCQVEDFHHVCPLPPLEGERMSNAVSSVDAWSRRHRMPGGSLYIAHAIKQVANVRRNARLVPARRRLIGLAVPKSAATSKGMPSVTPTEQKPE